MAKRLNVRENLSTLDEQPSTAPADVPSPAAPSASESDASSAEQEQPPVPAPSGPTAKRGGKSHPPGRQPSGSRPSKSSSSRGAAEPATADGEEPTEPAGRGGSAAAPSRPDALVPERQSDAKSLVLYLHPDDMRMLQLAKVEDSVDHQARFRAMLALYRSNTRFRASVDQVAKRQPKLQGRRYGNRT